MQKAMIDSKLQDQQEKLGFMAEQSEIANEQEMAEPPQLV